MTWTVQLHETFDAEWDELPIAVQDELLALMGLLKQFGPPARGYTERVAPREHEGAAVRRRRWRVAFAFDPKRRAILLVGGDKSGGSEKRFYRQLIRKADERFDAHIARIKSGRSKNR